MILNQLENMTLLKNTKYLLIRCGVRWDLQQFTFDCSECGGYAMERKDCPICLGVCNSVWERDVLAVSIRFKSFRANNYFPG